MGLSQKIVLKSGSGITLDKKRLFIKDFFSKFTPFPRKILIIPPDFTRFNSNAGELTSIIYNLFSASTHIDIMPALGTHFPMAEEEIRKMFGNEIPLERFFAHDWRNALVKKGEVKGEFVRDISEGKLDYSVNIEVNKKLFDGYDLILSIGQVVPHEVVGMANHTKNICVGVGGQDTINKSHFLGAVYGMERIMGRTESPVRTLYDFGVKTFLSELPIFYMLTVMRKNDIDGKMDMLGLFAGDDRKNFTEAAELSKEYNLNLLDEPIKKCVVYLDPHEFRSTWLGNKSIYRTRMAMDDGGELIVLAPGLMEFGEDPEIGRLIKKYGYRGTIATLEAVKKNRELRENLSAAAHLIHGSSEGRFTIKYCPGDKMPQEEIRKVGFVSAPYGEMSAKYSPDKLKDGWNTVDGEKIFFISNPGLGLWALKSRFTRQ